MRMVVVALLLVTLAASSSLAQPIGPDVASWLINTNGRTGYGGIPSNVQLVQFSDANVYVSCTCIPGYDIGPWAGNPNTPANQNFTFKITRTPQLNEGDQVATPLGHIGVWSNGVSVFNAKDARSYDNRDVWHQNAIEVEGPSFDTCLGHPAPNGEYHHHLNPRCLYNDRDSSGHSPIIGYAFDGFPIYGAYGFRNADGSGGVTRMRSSYRLREEMNTRTTLADGTVLTVGQQGPAISSTYPLGYYIEDFAFVAQLGDLDEHNGRQSVTPEYPEGTYAYFVTLDANGEAAYPYTLGPTYRGTVPPGNTGPQSGHNVPTEPVTTYTVSSVEADNKSNANIQISPNPAREVVRISCESLRWAFVLRDMMGGRDRAAVVAFWIDDTRRRGIIVGRVSSESGDAVGYKHVASRSSTLIADVRCDFLHRHQLHTAPMTPEERTAKWTAYYERTANEPPRKSLLRALELFGDERPGVAVDLGCGGGRDTLEMLERGWTVVAVDREPAAAERVASIVSAEHAPRLHAVTEPLETIDIPPCSLVNASYSLPFCSPDRFAEMWSRVTTAILPGGRFVGQFFGDRDEWRDNPELTFHTRAETLAYFDEFVIDEFSELDEDGTTSMGEAKHWHVFTVIARKQHRVGHTSVKPV